MWGQYHPIPYQSKLKEKFVGPLSISQCCWWAVGLWLSIQFAHVVPPVGTDWFYSRLPAAIPFAVCMFFCYVKHGGTGLPYWVYGYWVIRLRCSRRVFRYRRNKVIPGGDR